MQFPEQFITAIIITFAAHVLGFKLAIDNEQFALQPQIVHANAQFQSLIADYVQLNQLLDNCMPIMQPHKYLDCVLLHNLQVMIERDFYMLNNQNVNPMLQKLINLLLAFNRVT